MARNYLAELRSPALRPMRGDRPLSEVEYVAQAVREAATEEDMQGLVEAYAQFIGENGIDPRFARGEAARNLAIPVFCLATEAAALEGVEADTKRTRYGQWSQVLEGDPQVLAQRSASILQVIDWATTGSTTLKMRQYGKE